MSLVLAAVGGVVAQEPAPFVLPSHDGTPRLRFHTNAGSPGFIGLELEAFGEVLLGPAAGGTGGCPGLQVRPGGVPAGSAPLVRPRGGNKGAGWEYAAFDVTAAWGPRVSRCVRHLLFVEPDLFVIHDELQAPDPVEWELCLSSPGPLQTEAVSGNFVVEQARAGLAGHALVHPFRVLSPWTTAGVGEAGARLSARTSRPLGEFRAITVLLPHAAGRKRGSGFRMIVTDTAIGARIYRDGLPTLVAFNLGREDEAELAGLRFRGPVAVDVFRPKPRAR